MTHERDFDRVLEAWLSSGSTEMPDRLFEAVVDRIEDVPQRRVARAKLRFITMARNVKIAAVLAAAVVISVVGFAVLRGTNQPNVAGTRSPSPSASEPSPIVSASPPTGFGSVPNCLLGNCTGNLDAGTHTTTNFVHKITYVVPAGWADAEDADRTFTLERQADFAAETVYRSLNLGPSIYVLPDPAAAVQDASCNVTTQTGAGSTSVGLAASIAGRPGIVGSKPSDVTVGGLTGRMVDVQVASTWNTMCPQLDGVGVRQTAKIPYVALIRSTLHSSVSDPWEFGPVRPERQRYIFVDIGGGHTVAIVFIADPPLFDQLVADGMPIVASMTFTP
jgi:hypothetical protein